MQGYGGGKSPEFDVVHLWRMQTGLQPGDTIITPKEREILRPLAAKVAAIAGSAEMAARRELWRKHNRLENTRPLIFCDPENGWNEIITETQMKCQGKLARRWEFELRKEIFWGEEMGDDKPVEWFFDVPYTVSPDDWGLSAEIHQTSFDGAKNWQSALTDYDQDLPRLHAPQFEIDWKTSDATLHVAQELFGDLLKVRRKGTWWWSMGITVRAMFFRHIEQMYLDMIDYPDELKEMFSIISRGLMTKLDYLEANGLLSPNNDGTYVGSGGFGYADNLAPGDAEHVHCEDLWGFCESQEAVGISPAMYEEFIFPYEQPLLERFGMNCYGCCEPLHLRWNTVKQHANLRRVSCSPWTDIGKMSEHLGRDYIFSMKPMPTPVTLENFNAEGERVKLREAFANTRDNHVECIMKDTHTIGHRPQNVVDWCRVAKEEARKYE